MADSLSCVQKTRQWPKAAHTPLIFMALPSGSVISQIELPLTSPESSFRVVCISDTHNAHRTLTIPHCDVLLHCGDVLLGSSRCTKQQNLEKIVDFAQWLDAQPCHHRVVIAGNHDTAILQLGKAQAQQLFSIHCKNVHYLENDRIEIKGGLTIFGSPNTMGHTGNDAFRIPHEERRKFWNGLLRPQGSVDILMTHDDPFMDKYLGAQLVSDPDLTPQVHVCGHWHPNFGVHRLLFPSSSPPDGKVNPCDTTVGVLSCNVSTMDGHYKPSHPMLVFDIFPQRNAINQ